jgi:RNA polymerase sigma-70 factor (ECF subfamily)
MQRAEEAELIGRAAAGDKSAAAALIQAHQRSLYAYMLRMCGRPDVAEDVVQEAFVRVLSHLDRFDTRYRFSTWLFTIAKRLHVNACQKLKPTYDTDTVDSAGGAYPPETVVDDREQALSDRGHLDEALQMVSPEQREVLILFHQQDWPIALIAQHMGMPEGTIKSHLHRGRRRLREALEEVRERADRARRLRYAGGDHAAPSAAPAADPVVVRPLRIAGPLRAAVPAAVQGSEGSIA